MSQVNRTSRICLRYMTIYCTSRVVKELRMKELVIQLNQKFFPVKDGSDKVLHELDFLAQRWPDDFSNGSRDYILGKGTT